MNLDEIHFITKENLHFSVSLEQLPRFCKEYCEKYVSKSEENKMEFLKFSQDYTYFEPYYDFIICHLKWISYPSLIDNTSYVQCGDSEDSKVLRTMSSIKEFKYENMYKKYNFVNILINSNDKNIGLNDYTIDEGFFDHEGVFLSNAKTLYHEATARVILQGICTSNVSVIKDYNDIRKDKPILYEDYLMNRLGFLIIGEYRGYKNIICNRNLMTPKQLRLIREYDDLGYSCNYGDCETFDKDFAMEYRRSRR